MTTVPYKGSDANFTWPLSPDSEIVVFWVYTDEMGDKQPVPIDQYDGSKFNFGYKNSPSGLKFTVIGTIEDRENEDLGLIPAIIIPPPTDAIDVNFDPTGIPGATATNVQTMGAELYGKAGVTGPSSGITGTYAIGDLITLPNADLGANAAEFNSAPWIQIWKNSGGYYEKSIDVTWESSTQVSLSTEMVNGEDRLYWINLPK